ncbi:alpha/beta fold hydrolase [Spelaeicoccus albus]|uniref:Acyl-coenzyme A synthetase/AMP-(Fatty) acid ligase/pimeloyl-ACP methyl ester carboxylesterase n=1 Tax=Spelaeicoccus albus TaxID=1280376 RepID=A0A7Z0D4V2_9MICO|nr:alpha/beta fold hydrolase [Spelaeicoccus albus]NYI68858.1 acyl-coenzyme A synthetase/AMP-(fatty) acid ligase/pimeloyl-ACP methyl ester carboxylesterase [Spelaeicoccus albus]
MVASEFDGGLPAELPPAGLPGYSARLSRLVDVDGPDGRHTWHIQDNLDELTKMGRTVTGTVLCVHGNPTWSYLWRTVMNAMTQDDAGSPAWRVIAVDQLDMGYSERTGRARTLPERVADLSALTAALDVEGPVVTLGHDWGGVVSLGWAIDHPALLAGVILTNTAVHQPAGRSVPSPLRLALTPAVHTAGTVTTTAFLDTTLSLAHPRLSGEVRRAYRAPYRTAGRRRGIGAFVADIPVETSHPSFPELTRIADGTASLTVPALMLWGPRDPIFSDGYLRDLAERLPQAAIHRFEGAGHLLAEDVDIAGPIRNWLTDLAGDGAAAETPNVLAQAEPATRPDPGAGVEPVGRARVPIWRYLDELAGDDDTALVEMAPTGFTGPRVVSWRRLAEQVTALAAGLAAHGVRAGDRVSLLVKPGADLTAVMYACLRIGAVVVVADAGLGIAGLSRAVKGSGPDHIVAIRSGLTAARALNWPGQRIAVDPLNAPERRLLGVDLTLADVIRDGAGHAVPPAPPASADAAILFTSGSTGPAKGVVYTHARLEAMRDALADRYGIGHGSSLVAGFAPFALLGPALGATSVSPDMDVTKPKTLSAAALADAAAAVDATAVFASPAALANVLDTAPELTADGLETLRAVRLFLSAGAPLSQPLLTAAAGLMPAASIHTPYGMTEALLVTDVDLPQIEDAGVGNGVCVGVPIGPADVRISPLDGAGVPAARLTAEPNVTGEIVVAAPHIKDRYDRLWATQRRSARFPGRHATGDVGHLDGRGRLWVEGRLGHVITSPDGVITPVRPEQLIETVDGVRRAGVAGVGPAGTQQVVAVVETTTPTRRPRMAPPELAAAVRHAVAIPVAAIITVPELPTDVRHNSKVDRARLSAWASGVLAGGRMGRP